MTVSAVRPMIDKRWSPARPGFVEPAAGRVLFIRWTAMDPAANVAASRAAHRDGDTGPLRALLEAIVAR